MTTPPMIDCVDLVRIYRTGDIEVQALQGLNLTVAAGELTAIVGASGSGKSTLLAILSALDVASAGRAVVAGHDLLAMSARERARYRRETAGFVWQQTGRNFLADLTIGDNIDLAASLLPGSRRARTQRVRDVVGLLSITELTDRRPGDVTGSERQRAAIALALVNDPRVLFADEPTGDLDERSSTEVLEAMALVNSERGVTVLLVTHDPDVQQFVRRTVQIRDGRTSTEVFRTTEVDADGTHRRIAQEYAVLDRVGRLQLPRAEIERLGMRDRVRLGIEERHLEIRPDDEGLER
ncbi:ATP-binding cassette domain-containing protein [Microbacterium sp. 10M-3C3]|jgi:ABC-type lipoprotein export system ATPase subunit|uniref:ABC transporter ATP-binding protein n=1 Tax=Microbacterium sp. 10M-3C3 TaxID=2483401 RepID=UPI000F62EED6|nr:ATP-binding cassette domain-containing protein [Microbacterium sp. 10M-3C3]